MSLRRQINPPFALAAISHTVNEPYLLNDFHQVFQHLPALSHVFVGDDGCGEVAQDVRAHGLDGVQVPGKHQHIVSSCYIWKRY